jgi:hypothetical protein
MKRETGYYWVTMGAGWFVAHWESIDEDEWPGLGPGEWTIVGDEQTCVDSEFKAINEQRLILPTEPNEK